MTANPAMTMTMATEPAGGGMEPATAGASGDSSPATGEAGQGGSAEDPMMMDGSETGASEPDLSSCPPAPDGAPASAVAALEAVNRARLAAGAGCVRMVAEINTAAEKHCQYYAMNANTDCTADPHSEVMGCDGYVGDMRTRLQSAGYTGPAMGEVMAFSNNPESAVSQWINSVWHRIPLLDPWTMDMGYGAAERCDTIDFGAPGSAPADSVLVYPYDGQTDVPPSFNGMYEGPMPPAPPTGWPSAMPITLYGRDLNISEHVLTKDGDPTPIEHTWITGSDPMWGRFLRTSVFMYAHQPFEPNTTYHVKMSGTYVGGAIEREWSFTTGEASRWGR